MTSPRTLYVPRWSSTSFLVYCSSARRRRMKRWVDGLAPYQVQDHSVVGNRIAETVDGRYGGHDDAVAVLEQGLCRRQSHLLDVVVDRRVLLDVGVRRRYIGFRLVVVVVRDEVLDGSPREELPHLAVELRRQRLVRGQDQGRPPDALDDLRHRERLSRASDAEQRLVRKPGLDALDQLLDGSRLIAGRGEIRDDGQGSGTHGRISGIPVPIQWRGRAAHRGRVLATDLVVGFVDRCMHAA